MQKLRDLASACLFAFAAIAIGVATAAEVGADTTPAQAQTNCKNNGACDVTQCPAPTQTGGTVACNKYQNQGDPNFTCGCVESFPVSQTPGD